MRTSVVTGASSGIGLETARSLATHGFHVVAGGRSESRTMAVVDAITAAGGSAEWLALDLSSLDQVRASANDLLDRRHTVDVLINNAGIGMAKGETEDGFEINFGVNHLGPFLFTSLLQPAFRAGTRILAVTSAMHHRVESVDYDALTRPSRSFLGLHDYAVSKLANIMFIAEMSRRRPQWPACTVHPGFVDTKIIPGWVRPFVRNRLIEPAESANAIVRYATEETPTDAGGYYTRSGRSEPSRLARDEDAAREMWERSERWCGLNGAA